MIKYVGGKSRIAERIAALLPPHHCYVEPFAGGLAVLRAKVPAPIEIVNDLDGELIHLYKTIAFRGEEFLAALESLPVSRRLFAEWQKADPNHLSPVWRAVRIYYLLQYSWGGKGQQFNAHHTRPSPRLTHSVLEAFRARTAWVIWESMDALMLIERYDSPGTLFYVDPPYLDKDWYTQKFGGLSRHRHLRDSLVACRGKWLLSHSDHPEIRALYAGFPILEISVHYQISAGPKRPVNELLIANYPINKKGPVSPQIVLVPLLCPKPHTTTSCGYTAA